MQLFVTMNRDVYKIDKKDIALKVRHDVTVPHLYCAGFYFPDNSIIVEEGTVGEDSRAVDQQIVNIVNSHSDYERVIFINFNGITENLYANIKGFNLNFPFYLTTASLQFFYKNNNEQIVFYPEEALLSHHKDILDLGSRTHKFSCLNNNTWSHRVLTYMYLSDKQYFKDMIFSWNSFETGMYHTQEEKFYHTDFTNDIELTEAEIEKYKSLPSKFIVNNFIDDNNPKNPSLSINNAAFANACCNIVTESSSRKETSTLSEKTYKPIRSCQFFVIVGGVGLIQHLRDTGFDTFDDIIDHSYDSIEDDRQRIAAVIQEVDRLEALDLFSLHKQSADRFIKNQQWLKNPQFVEQFLPLKFDK